jgi:type VII secretion-associated serine protease mycosin
VAAAPAGADQNDDAGPAGAPIELFAVEAYGDGLEVTTYEARTAVEAAKIISDLRAAGRLVSVDVDAPVHALVEPMRPQQWALDHLAFEAAWSNTSGAGVIVAVVDTGVWSGHEDLAGAVIPGIDYVSGGDGRRDSGGHGTHVAGIVGARLNNRGIAGAAPGVSIMPVRVLDANGVGYMSNVAAGIIWAVDHGADVVTMSLGGTSPAAGVQTAIQYARSRGALVFAAAGNNAQSGNPVVYPAAYPEAVAVGAVDANLQRAPYSSYHSYVDFAAPGTNIVSTYTSGPSSYATASGTSMATPYAAAAAALVKAANPTLSAGAVEQILASTARDLGAPGRDPHFGHGLIDPRAAVAQARAVQPANPGGTRGAGYWVVTADGRVRNFGQAGHFGDLAGRALPAPIVAATPTATGRGYWLAGRDGRVYAFGDARHHGDMGGLRLNGGIVGMAVTPTGRGYFLLGSDGGIFTFGDAVFKGSTGNLRLNAPVLDMTVTRTGRGYWLVAADGGIFTFGDAVFKGSTGNLRLNQPVSSMTAARSGSGYWLVARDGGMFAFGVPFHGSLPGIGIPATDGQRIRALPDGSGYYVLTGNGGVYAFGKAKVHGAAAPLSPLTPAVDLMLVP